MPSKKIAVSVESGNGSDQEISNHMNYNSSMECNPQILNPLEIVINNKMHRNLAFVRH
jgi:hypothetical protein